MSVSKSLVPFGGGEEESDFVNLNKYKKFWYLAVFKEGTLFFNNFIYLFKIL